MKTVTNIDTDAAVRKHSTCSAVAESNKFVDAINQTRSYTANNRVNIVLKWEEYLR